MAPIAAIFSAVLFDMDGLMFDTEKVFLQAWNSMKGPLGLDEYPVHAEPMIGISKESSIRYLIDAGMDEEFARNAYTIIDVLRADWVAAGKAPAKPGLLELLTFLQARGLRMAVASSGDRAHVHGLLELEGIGGYFQAVATGDDVPAAKPAPDVFLLAAERLGVPPGSCLVLEDSYHGIRAARAAGMLPVMVPDILPPNEEMQGLCAACLPDLHAVKDWMKQNGL